MNQTPDSLHNTETNTKKGEKHINIKRDLTSTLQSEIRQEMKGKGRELKINIATVMSEEIVSRKEQMQEALQQMNKVHKSGRKLQKLQ